MLGKHWLIMHDKSTDKKLKRLEGQTRDAAHRFMVENYGSEEEFDKQREEIRIRNLREGIIDFSQLKDFFEERIPGFDEYYRYYISENKPPMTEYEFLSFLFRPYLEECYGKDHHNLRLIWDSFEYILEHGDEGVKNELKVVIGEEVGLKGHYGFMGKLTKQFLSENQIYPEPKK